MDAGGGKRWGFEETACASAGLALVCACACACVVRDRLRAGGLTDVKARVAYGLEHLPGALLAACCFLVLVAAGRWLLVRWKPVGNLPSTYFVGAVGVAFCLFWLPAVLAGGFDRDDWMLLGAASVRKVLAGQPWLAWQTLDSVDGNFRPVGTVLYMGILLRHFGVWARPFLLGLFAVNLLGTLVAFAIVRTLGYSRMAAAAAAILYLSRSQTYTIMTWTCALGDAVVILLCGCMALALLAAIKRSGRSAAVFHVLAWGCFCVATLAKQSAFAAPMIVGLLLLLRPGTAQKWTMHLRLREAALGVAVYGATAAVPFFHAKRLLAGVPPYPVAFSLDALLRTFAYAAWYLGTFEFPSKYKQLLLLPPAAGILAVCAVVLALRRWPRLLGERPRDVAFCALAGVASLSLFAVLPARVAPYYGSMAAFWVSLALGIALSRFGWAEPGNQAGRVCCLIFCVLVVMGFVDVRLKQTGLFPAGGYTWGASEVGLERALYGTIAQELAARPETQAVLLEDMPDDDSIFANMAIIANPGLERVLTYRSAPDSYFANDRGGRVPVDDLAGLRNPRAYNWNVPLNRIEAERLLSNERVLRLKFNHGKIAVGHGWPASSTQSDSRLLQGHSIPGVLVAVRLPGGRLP